MKTIDETRIEALAKHIRGMDDLGLGQFRLQTLNGSDFTILQNGKPHFRGTFEQVAQHAGWTDFIPLPSSSHVDCDCAACLPFTY